LPILPLEDLVSRDKEIRKDLDRQWEEFLEIMKEFAWKNTL